MEHKKVEKKEEKRRGQAQAQGSPDGRLNFPHISLQPQHEGGGKRGAGNRHPASPNGMALAQKH